MKKKHLIYFVAFIDILGFNNMIDEHFSGSDSHSLNFLKQALKHAKSYAVNYNKVYLKQFNLRFTFKQFSDCVSISMPLEQSHDFDFVNMCGIFINVVRAYQLILLDNNILCRGGIAMGPHIENSDMIFSKAIVKAYQLESKKAIYPRIIIDKEITDLLIETLKADQEKYTDFTKVFAAAFVKDWTGEISSLHLGCYSS